MSLNEYLDEYLDNISLGYFLLTQITKKHYISLLASCNGSAKRIVSENEWDLGEDVAPPSPACRDPGVAEVGGEGRKSCSLQRTNTDCTP